MGIHKSSNPKILVTLGLKILSFFRQKVVFEAYVIKCLTAVKIINYGFSMKNCFVKESKSIQKSNKFALR